MSRPICPTPPAIKPLSPTTLPGLTTETIPHVDARSYDARGYEATKLTLMWPGGTIESHPRAAASLMPAMLREGTTSRSGHEIADALDFNGATFAGRADAHFTGIEIVATNDRWPALMPIVIDMITHPAFDPTTLDAVARQAAANIDLRSKRVAWRASEALLPVIYGQGHPLSTSITAAETLAVTPDQLRRWHSRVITDGGCRMFLAGEITPQVRQCVESLAAALPGGTELTPCVTPLSPGAVGRITTPVPDSLQSAVDIMLPAVPRSHPDYLPLQHTVTALGGYFGSRLMTNIREDKGYTYGISAGLLGTLEGAYINIKAECDPAYTEALLAEIAVELRRITTEPPTGDELQRLKRHVVSGMLATVASPFDIVNYHITSFMVGMPAGYFEQRQTTAIALTPQIIATIANRYLRPELMRISVAGPQNT